MPMPMTTAVDRESLGWVETTAPARELPDGVSGENEYAC